MIHKIRLLLPVLLLLLISRVANSQQPLPASYSPGQINYLRTWQTKAPIKTSDSLALVGDREVKVTTIYVDGHGRNLQTVVRQGSMPTGGTIRDLVKGQVYDKLGRHQIDYLLFAANNQDGNTSLDNGGFKHNPFAQQAAYYNSRLAGQPGETNTNGSLNWAYNLTQYDGTPLDRVQKVMAAGSSWVGADRGVQSKYWINTAGDSVRSWQVTDVSSDWGTYQNTGQYAAGELYKNVTIDEQGKQIIEFKNKSGQLVLKKVQRSATPDDGTGSGHAGWVCNYYLYDDMDRLRLIVQPMGVELLQANNWNTTALSGTILSEQCFRMEYNARGQLIRKKDPGAGEVWMVYDTRDRLVMVQDGNLRAGSPVKWRYTKYDELNRPLSTGLIETSGTAYTHDGAAVSSADYPSLSGATYEELTQLHYDDYGNLPAGFSTTYSTLGINSLSINTSYFTSPDYAEPLIQTKNPAGMLTWARTKVLGTSQWITIVNYYDDKGRLIQERMKNISGGISSTTKQYNFAGQVIRMVHRHVKEYPNGLTTAVYTQNTYDELGRLQNMAQKVNSTVGDWKTIVEYGYDEIGQVKTKKLGTNPVTGLPLETQELSYNVRGWLLGANRSFAVDSTNDNNFFGYDLAYDNDGPAVHGTANPVSAKRYDGAIGRVLWKSAGDHRIRKYELAYDAQAQLTGATFAQFKGSAFTQSDLDFSMTNVSYDINGNLQTLSQKGWKPSGTLVIDSLLYTYFPGTNRLKNVIDGTNDTATTMGDFRAANAYMTSLGGTKTAAATDYDYDANGNIRSDLNKELGAIQYNHLSLPEMIHLPGKGTVKYIYDANGIRLKKIVVDSTVTPVVTTTHLYIDGFVYLSREHAIAQPDDIIEKQLYFNHAEGRARFDFINGYQYDFFIKDHLGSVRMILTEEQKTDPYPSLSWEGEASSDTVTAQNTYWEDKTGSSINVAGVRVNRPGAFGDVGTNGDFAHLVRKSTGSIGAAKLLKTMKGDRLHLYAEYYYAVTNANNSGASGISSLLTSFASALTASGATAQWLKPGASTLIGDLSGNTALGGLLNTAPNSSGGNQAPKSYLNVLFFDEQMRFDENASRVFPVAYQPGTKGSIDKRLADAIAVPRNGYAYIFYSNESDEFVYWDNFMLTHEHGTLQEEQHYYPFGLQIAAISSRTIGFEDNKVGYNGKEHQTKEIGGRYGSEWYDYGARMSDPQIGRWMAPDPNSNAYAWTSPYAYSFNNPMQVIDPTGRDGVVTGSGSKDDPYVVRANYYYHGLNEEQRAAFHAALNEYNNNGKSRAIKTEEGTIYVKFELTGTQTENAEQAQERANSDVVETGNRRARFGNVVTVGNVAGQNGYADEDTYGAANDRNLTLDDADLVSLNERRPGGNLDNMRKGNAIHEIGHNLGGVHGDPGNVMTTLHGTEIKRENCAGGDCGSGQWSYQLQSVDNGGVRAIIGRMGTPRNSVESRYITPRETRKLEEQTRAGMLILVNQ